MKGEVRGGGCSELQSCSELIQAEGGNPLFDSLPLLSSCGGQKKQNKKKTSHVLLSSALYLEQCPGYTHLSGAVGKSVISPGHPSGAAQLKKKKKKQFSAARC